MNSTHISSAITNTNTKHRTCYFCNAEEGKIRKIVQFEVSLRTVTYESELKLACQSCARKAVNFSHTKKEDYENGFSGLKKIFTTFSTTCFLIALFSFDILAQMPGLPAPPSQAPIDGGLGLLAAAGGAYAWKKLRGKSES